LIHHKRIGAWLPPGGHLDPGELPHQAAVRETMEETGLAVEVLSTPLPHTPDAVAFFLPQPLCIQGVQATEKGAALYHIDIAYICRPAAASKELPALKQTEDVLGARWIALSALDEVPLARNVREIVSLALEKVGHV
jgi:ADP-ribose pyrophosphatase YjhB (NUDIX family)